MLEWQRAVAFLEEQMKVTYLIQYYRVIDDASLVYLVKLFDCVLLLEVKAEDAVHHFSHVRDTADQQDLLC